MKYYLRVQVITHRNKIGIVMTPVAPFTNMV